MNKPTIFYIVGLPASGKSTYAKELSKEYGADIFSSDAIREELFGDQDEQGNPQEIFNLLHKRVKEALRNGKNVILDATNVSSKKRCAFLSELRNIPCNKICIIVATPYEICVERNKKRNRNVPEYAIKKMYLNWNTPYWHEGWNDIRIHYTVDDKNEIHDWIYEYFKYNQENPHHELTLGQHCFVTGTYLISNDTLCCAGLLHDCGKPFTKEFKNGKGDLTEIAHYFNHQNCSSYDSLFFVYPENVNVLDVSILINLHMIPYFWEKDNNEKMRLKYQKLWGDVLYDKVMLLHEADRNAH